VKKRQNCSTTFRANFGKWTKRLSRFDRRQTLFRGAMERKGASENNAIIQGNDDFLRKGKSIAKDTTSKLREAMGDLRQADEMGREAIAVLAEDEERMRRVNENLDQIDSDLAISTKVLCVC
jgi:hypothetical protein